MADPTPQAAGAAPAPLPVIDRFMQESKIIRDDSQRPFAQGLLNEYAIRCSTRA